MQAAHDRQKSYANLKRKPIEFQVEDKVMLKVLPWKGVVHFGKRGKLNPRYVGPFKVLEKVGEVSYKLKILEELSRVHNTFNVSNLKKFYVEEPLAVLLDGLYFDDKLQFVEEPVEIMDREVKWLKRSRIPLIKVKNNPDVAQSKHHQSTIPFSTISTSSPTYEGRIQMSNKSQRRAQFNSILSFTQIEDWDLLEQDLNSNSVLSLECARKWAYKQKMMLLPRRLEEEEKQIARKGLHSDKTDEDESEASKDVDPISCTNIYINHVPVAIKPPSIATYKIIKQGKKSDVFQIIGKNG
ncbi:hypothetical protein Tco_0323584 [Tanacetum coccineum]